MNTPTYAQQKCKQEDLPFDRHEAIRQKFADFTLDEFLEQLHYIVDELDLLHPNDTVEEVTAKLEELCKSVSAKPTEQNILDLMLKARANGLKYPKVQISAEPKIMLVMNAKGDVNITNGGRYGTPENKWYGKIINVNGSGKASIFFREQFEHDGKGALITIHTLLAQFANNPAQHSANLGKQTNHCQFCRKQLTHSDSVAVGYGPTCAENYGLPWGDAK